MGNRERRDRERTGRGGRGSLEVKGEEEGRVSDGRREERFSF